MRIGSVNQIFYDFSWYRGRVDGFKICSHQRKIFSLLLCRVYSNLCRWYISAARGLGKLKTFFSCASSFLRNLNFVQCSHKFPSNYPISTWFFQLCTQSFTQVDGSRANFAIFPAFNFTFHSKWIKNKNLLELRTRLYTKSTVIERRCRVELKNILSLPFPDDILRSCAHEFFLSSSSAASTAVPLSQVSSRKNIKTNREENNCLQTTGFSLCKAISSRFFRLTKTATFSLRIFTHLLDYSDVGRLEKIDCVFGQFLFEQVMLRLNSSEEKE